MTSSSTSSSRRAVDSVSSTEDLFNDDNQSDGRRVPDDSTSHDVTQRPSATLSAGKPADQTRAATATAVVASAHVSTFQITPSLRQRAFPRTNPAYIGTYRRDRAPTFRRVDCPAASVGVASELRPPAAAHNGTRRPNSDGLQRALIQHTGDVVYARRGARQSSTVVTHHRLHHDFTSTAGASVRPSSDSAGGGGGNCRSLVAGDHVTRRQSEPDYVNVMTRHQYYHHHHHHQQQQQVAPPSASYHVTEDTSHSQLVPSAIYMNQHELTIAGRYTSRSTCNFMDHTANGNLLLILFAYLFVY